VEQLLRAQWQAAMAGSTMRDRAPAHLVEDTFVRLMARYREPHRRYHTVAHLAATLSTAELLLERVPVQDPAAVRLALFFHDAVYDPRSPTNEAASAALARSELPALGIEPGRVDAVAAMVLATARAGDPDAEPDQDGDRDVVLDADLAVLGAAPAVYAAYVQGVRSEYGHVDDDAWRRGRAEVLKAFLARPVLYRTPPMQPRDARARANLQAELVALRG
jgi:predicted metal-dependent HD superfamily phosphohydrolase